MLRVELRCFLRLWTCVVGTFLYCAANYKWHMSICFTQTRISFFGSHMLFLSCSLLLWAVVCLYSDLRTFTFINSTVLIQTTRFVVVKLGETRSSQFSTSAFSYCYFVYIYLFTYLTYLLTLLNYLTYLLNLLTLLT